MWVLVLLALIVASPATAETDNDTVVQSAKPRFQIVDGDTVKFGPQLVRLFGIDAPEKGQTCDDGQWHPGPRAKEALKDFIAGRPVTCKQVDYDARDNRPVAQCFAGEDDLQAMMVSAGWAWSFGRYSDRYAPEEREAMGQKAGVHAHRCVPPWEWRRTNGHPVGVSASLLHGSADVLRSFGEDLKNVGDELTTPPEPGDDRPDDQDRR